MLILDLLLLLCEVVSLSYPVIHTRTKKYHGMDLTISTALLKVAETVLKLAKRFLNINETRRFKFVRYHT